MSRRFPFPIPFGWFHVAYPEDLAPGEVTALRYWNRDLVLWRGDDGEYHLQDAYCPHLGAHLGLGGTVEDGALACPFHGWRFDGAGACVDIPYSDRVNKKAKVHTYETVVRNEMVFAWYHPHDEAPGWEVPDVAEVADPEFSDWHRQAHVIRTIPQEMSENGADPAHFLFVHGTDTVAEVESYETDGPFSTMISKQSYVTPRGVTWGHIDVYNYGPGLAKIWFSGIIDAVNLATTVPIDEDTTQVRFNFKVRRQADAALTSTVADAFVREINKQIVEDTPIWEHKTFIPTPALADTDGPIMAFRKWYSQFYAEPYHVPARP